MKQVFLSIGETYFSRDACRVRTVLGSCVAVCLWDQRRGHGGITHFLLPQETPPAAVTPSNLVPHGEARYASFALPDLLSRLTSNGSVQTSLVAKVFGGANVLPVVPGTQKTVGALNIDYAFEFLEQADIKIASHRIGGDRGIRIDFMTHTGQVYVRELDAVHGM